MIVSPLALRGEDVERREEAIPLVLLGERLTGLAVDHVIIDNEAAARTVTSHLVGLGRRLVAAVGAEPHIREGTAIPRLRGYREALTLAGLPYDHALVVPVERPILVSDLQRYA